MIPISFFWKSAKLILIWLRGRESNRFMETDVLKVLFIGKDAQFAQAAADMLRETNSVNELTISSSIESSLSALKKNVFNAALFELEEANVANLFQVTALAVRAPKV